MYAPTTIFIEVAGFSIEIGLVAYTNADGSFSNEEVLSSDL